MAAHQLYKYGGTPTIQLCLCMSIPWSPFGNWLRRTSHLWVVLEVIPKHRRYVLQPMAIVTFQSIYELAVLASLRCVNEENRGSRLGVWGYRYVDIPLTYFPKQKPPGFRLANNRQQIPLIYTFHTCLITAMSHRIFSFRMIAKRIRSYVYWAAGMLVCAGLLQFNCCVSCTNMNICTVYNIHAWTFQLTA